MGYFSTGDTGWGQIQPPAREHIEIPFEAEILIHCSLPPWREFQQGGPCSYFLEADLVQCCFRSDCFKWLLLDGLSAVPVVGRTWSAIVGCLHLAGLAREHLMRVFLNGYMNERVKDEI